jgi:hypothetical protein
VNAAGHGWFIDENPYQDSEFIPQGNDEELIANAASAAYGDMDLLTVVMHELGHVFGYTDLDPQTSSTDLMSAMLEEGERNLPAGASSGAAQSKDSLILMDYTPEPGVAESALAKLVNENPWLIKYLVDGAQDDPNSDISIVLPIDDQPVDPEPVAPPSNGKGKQK